VSFERERRKKVVQTVETKTMMKSYCLLLLERGWTSIPKSIEDICFFLFLLLGFVPVVYGRGLQRFQAKDPLVGGEMKAGAPTTC
jgi:hypothetical protein